MNAEENCQKRLAADRERHAIARANESAEKRQKRLADERERRAIARAPLRLTSAILKEHRCHFIPKRCDA